MSEKIPDSFKRYRFSVPHADESVVQWIDAQSNLSFSIRELIKTAIRCNGFSDVSCYPVRQILMEVPMQQIPAGAVYPIELMMYAQGRGLQTVAPAASVGPAPASQPTAAPVPMPGPEPAGPAAATPFYPQPAPQSAPQPVQQPVVQSQPQPPAQPVVSVPDEVPATPQVFNDADIDAIISGKG